MKNKLEYVFLQKLNQFFSHHNKWVKDDYTSRDGKRCCLLGACQRIDNYAMVPSKIRISSEKLIVKACGGKDIASFNDDKKTKFKDVKKVIRKAIILSRQE